MKDNGLISITTSTHHLPSPLLPLFLFPPCIPCICAPVPVVAKPSDLRLFSLFCQPIGSITLPFFLLSLIERIDLMNRTLQRTRRIAIPSVILVKQTPSPTSDSRFHVEADVQALLRRIEILENSVAQLRAQLQNPPPPWWVDPEIG
jgi:hypothetical protein